MYKNEREFSQKFCSALKKRKMHPVQIETGLTQQGVPDLFVMAHGDDVWIELKNIWEYAPHVIPWRPGQQAWHLKYYKHHNKKKCVYTVCAMKQGYVVIKMTKMFVDNIVHPEDVISFNSIDEVIDYVTSLQL